MFPVDTSLVLRLDKDAYGKKAFFLLNWSLINHAVKLHDYWFVAVVKKRTNGSAAELHEPMATIPARSCQNGRGIWLYKRSFRHRILRFLLLQRRRLRLHWPRSLLAVDTPRSWTQRPRSARLIPFSTRPSIAAVPVPFAAAIRRFSRKFLKEQIGILRPPVTVARAGLPCTPMPVTASVFLLGEIPCRCHARWLWLSHARASVSPLCARGSLSFQSSDPPLAPSRFLPPRDLWGKNGGRGSQRPVESELTPLRSRVPCFRHTERCLPSFFPNLTSVPLQAWAIWSRSGKWRWAGRWQHVTGSFRCWGAVGLSDWPRPLTFARAQRRQSRDGCRTFPCPLKSGWRAGFGVVSTRGALSQPSGWVVSAGAPSGPSATTIAVLPWSLTSSRDLGAPLTLPASVLPLHPPSLQLTALKKRDMRGCLN